MSISVGDYFNPYLPSVLFHPYQLNNPIFRLKVSDVLFLIFYFSICIEIHVRKKCRPCQTLSSGSTMVVYVAKRDAKLVWVNYERYFEKKILPGFASVNITFSG